MKLTDESGRLQTGVSPEERKKIFREIKILGIIFVVVGIIVLIVMGMRILSK
jgi:hypothetical protein